MAEETEKPPFVDTDKNSLDPRLIKQLEAAEKSIDKGNPEYAIDVCMGILTKVPACSAVRKVLHRAQLSKMGKGNPIKKFSAQISGLFFAAKAASLMKKNAQLDIIAAAEKELAKYPDNKLVSKSAALAAESLEYWPTAVVFWEDIVDFNPKDMASYVSLGNALIKALQPDEAIKVGERILRVSPGNGDAQAIMRSASVVKTMSDKWKESKTGSFRDNLKGADEAAEREKETRLVNDEESMRHNVENLSAEVEKDPENINLYKEIITNLKGLKEYGKALEVLAKARQQPMGQADSSLEKLYADLFVLDSEKQIAALQADIEQSPDEQKSKALAELKSKLHAFKLETAKTMVERYPNDFTYRYIYGNLLYEEGRMDDAIAQFQISQKSPKVRSQSLLGLGMAFVAGKKYDMAVDQLKVAKGEIKIFTDQKKDIIYELGKVYELMGKVDDAISEYKEIYAVDINYKDVAKKINAYYENKNK